MKTTKLHSKHNGVSALFYRFYVTMMLIWLGVILMEDKLTVLCCDLL